MKPMSCIGDALRAAACAGAALLVVGCTELPQAPVDPRNDGSSFSGSRPMREFHLGRVWVGRPSAELVQAWGAPRLVLNVPGFQQQQALIMVFFDRDPAGGCIDAFVVGRDGEQRISNYVCR